jgi:hypothetical protein
LQTRNDMIELRQKRKCPDTVHAAGVGSSIIRGAEFHLMIAATASVMTRTMIRDGPFAPFSSQRGAGALDFLLPRP